MVIENELYQWKEILSGGIYNVLREKKSKKCRSFWPSFGNKKITKTLHRIYQGIY
jgi:hypothetical protein